MCIKLEIINKLANCYHFQPAPIDMHATCQANEIQICSRPAVSSHSELAPKCSVRTDIRLPTRKMEPVTERTVPRPTPLYVLQSLHRPPELPEGDGTATLRALMGEIALTQPVTQLSAAPGI